MNQKRYFMVWISFVFFRSGIETYIAFARKLYENIYSDTEIDTAIGILAVEVFLATVVGQWIGGTYLDYIKNQDGLDKADSSRATLSQGVNQFTTLCVFG